MLFQQKGRMQILEIAKGKSVATPYNIMIQVKFIE